jgi:hypothetical protein
LKESGSKLNDNFASFWVAWEATAHRGSHGVDFSNTSFPTRPKKNRATGIICTTIIQNVMCVFNWVRTKGTGRRGGAIVRVKKLIKQSTTKSDRGHEKESGFRDDTEILRRRPCTFEILKETALIRITFPTFETHCMKTIF